VLLAEEVYLKLTTAGSTESMDCCRVNILLTPAAKVRLASSVRAVLIWMFRLTIHRPHATLRFRFQCAAVTKRLVSTSSTGELKAIQSVEWSWETSKRPRRRAQLRSCWLTQPPHPSFLSSSRASPIRDGPSAL